MLAPVRFDRVDVKVEGLTDWSELVARLGQGIRAMRRQASEDTLVLRPRLTGTTPLAWRILRDLDMLREEAVSVAEGVGSVWIDKVENGTQSGTAVAGSGLMAGIAAEAVAGLAQDPAILAAADREIDDLLKALPKELRMLLGQSDAATAAARDDLLALGVAEVLARLGSGEAA